MARANSRGNIAERSEKLKYYNLVVHGGITPERFGPYASEREQLVAARSLTEDLHIEGEDTLLGLDVSDGGEPEVWPYSYWDLATEQR